MSNTLGAYGTGLVVVKHAITGWARTPGMAGSFGFVAHATYDLSNLATLKRRPVTLSLIDMAWGSAVRAPPRR